MINPFTTYGYESPEYFCDRVNETAELTRLLTNGNNVALISPRRIGKTGLIHHCFEQDSIKQQYVTILIDIYATKSLSDLVFLMGKAIVMRLKTRGQKALDKFLSIVTSLRTGISFDGMGNASWNINIGDINAPEFTLDEIFSYLGQSEMPCIVAIDEFQTISTYPERNVEALMRTYIQECRNAAFIFSGSQRSMMNEIFISPSRPFYQSVTIMHVGAISVDKYVEFAQHHFDKANKKIEGQVIIDIYNKFDGVTWYVQKMLNELFSLTPAGEKCTKDDIDTALSHVIHSHADSYSDIIFQLNQSQTAILQAIASEGKATGITSSAFIKRHHLNSASAVQKAVSALLSKQLITTKQGTYELCDKFMSMWLTQRM